MKTIVHNAGLLVRLGIVATALLLSQQALAVGTDAGTAVSNTATVNYSVDGNAQAPIESSPTGNALPGVGEGEATEFLVDRRVNFTLAPVAGALTQVTPGDASAWVDFLLTNTSNSDLDFNLLIANLADGADVRGLGTDNADVTIPPAAAASSISVSSQTVSGGDADPILGGPTFVDNLPEDEAIRIRVWVDVPNDLVNLDVAGVQLDATAADPVTTVNLEETAGADVADQVDNVFDVPGADTNGNATAVAVDGFTALSAAVSVRKEYAVISGDLGSGKPIPGSRVEYTITIDNSAGAVAATGVTITDIIDGDVTFVTGQYGGEDVNLNGGGSCVADAADGDADGCSLDLVGTDNTLVIGDNDDLTIDVPALSTYVIQFQVDIPNL